jgi:aspartyl-tRNA(Asn)/glutamyl-tRNA(Gln) amidotransferase subunit C
MTDISINDVHRLAQLSSLQLDDVEAEALRNDLASILGYIDQLAELNTEGVEPTYQVTDLQNVWRDDIVDDYGIDRGQLLALAPEADQHQIKVPKVL